MISDGQPKKRKPAKKPKRQKKGKKPPVQRENQGGQGGPKHIKPTSGQTSDTRLLERAVRQRWPIPEEYREAIVRRQVKIAIDPDASPREASVAARNIIAMESQNQADEHKLHPDQHDVRISVEYDDAFYGQFDEDDPPTEAIGPPTADSAEPGPVQAGHLRPTLGQNGNGADGDG